jgi:aminoglycoside 6'-N-acetyltransferase I
MSSDTVEVKLLSVQDVAVLDRVETDVFDFPVQRALAEQYLSTPGNLLAVATASGVVVGMASAIAYVHPDKPLQLFINEVGVAQRVHGQGIGKRLTHALLEHGRERGCTEAWVATERNNRAARALYSSLGGVEEKDHAVVYTWQLRSELPGAKGVTGRGDR